MLTCIVFEKNLKFENTFCIRLTPEPRGELEEKATHLRVGDFQGFIRGPLSTNFQNKIFAGDFHEVHV